MKHTVLLSLLLAGCLASCNDKMPEKEMMQLNCMKGTRIFLFDGLEMNSKKQIPCGDSALVFNFEMLFKEYTSLVKVVHEGDTGYISTSFTVSAETIKEIESNRRARLSRKRPFFNTDSPQFMAIAAVWIALSFAVGAMGSKKSVGYFRALVFSLILSPLVGFLIVTFAADKKDTA